MNSNNKDGPTAASNIADIFITAKIYQRKITTMLKMTLNTFNELYKLLNALVPYTHNIEPQSISQYMRSHIHTH